MKLHMRSRQEPLLTPVETFPDDSEGGLSMYPDIMSAKYLASMEYLEAGAVALNVKIDSITRERWRRLAVTSYYIDDFIDTADNKEEAHALYALGLQAALGEEVAEGEVSRLLGTERDPLLLPSIELLRSSVMSASPDALIRLRTAALTINDAARDKANTDDIKQYVEILNEEIAATVDLLDHTAHETTTVQAGYAKLREVMHNAMQVAVFADSALDLKDDYEQGVTKVTPTARHIGRLALQAVRPARALIQPDGSLGASWQMLREIRPYIKLR